MIELKDDQLCFHFPEVHPEARCRIEFQRTLRIPDDNREYPLPAGLGSFPLFHVDDFRSKVPNEWIDHGGVFLPMYQSEAMWVNFSGRYPFAVKVAAGKINAVTGKEWFNELDSTPQDYVVIPEQPWLDGFNVGKDLIRQFVAMPLGQGYTAEEQLTGEAAHGGVQIIAYPMKREAYEQLQKSVPRFDLGEAEYESVKFCLSENISMGLAPGGLMRQQIYDDDYGFDVWEHEARSRCFVHLVNSEVFCDITGHRPPTGPPTPEQYADAGLPWFDYFDADREVLDGAEPLASLDSVAAKRIKEGKSALSNNDPVLPKHVKRLGPSKNAVREGSF